MASGTAAALRRQPRGGAQGRRLADALDHHGVAVGFLFGGLGGGGSERRFGQLFAGLHPTHTHTRTHALNTQNSHTQKKLQWVSLTSSFASGYATGLAIWLSGVPAFQQRFELDVSF
jgi:hypothetical protein